MGDSLDSLSPILLMGPGPSCVTQTVYVALAKTTIGHLDPRSIGLMGHTARKENVDLLAAALASICKG